MKLTVQVKLLPDPAQAGALVKTLEAVNSACDEASEFAWGNKEFRRFPLHKALYHRLRESCKLSAQVICLLFAKVADAYKLDKKCQRTFRKHGSIAFDSRILSFKLPESTVSIWTVEGRQKMPFVCGDKQRELLAFPRGEADLVLRKGKWFLSITVEIPEEKEHAAVDCLGVDLGIVEIAADSDGNRYSGSMLNKVRQRNLSLRRKLQRKGTKSAKRLLKKRSKREANFARNTNHVISRRIVSLAKHTNRAIAIEDLAGIRTRIRARKRERTKLHSWSFAQLGELISYKAKLAGVAILRIDPRYTSQQCSKCGHTEKANRKSRNLFVCRSCGHTQHADENGASNIRLRGLALLSTGAFKHPYAEVIPTVGTVGVSICNPLPLGRGI